MLISHFWVSQLPFGRLPIWNPNTGLPAPFTALTGAVPGETGGVLPSGARYGNVCSYDSLELLHGGINGWHGGVHGALGGPFGNIHTAAQAPIFFPWHTAVDQIAANWEQCLN